MKHHYRSIPLRSTRTTTAPHQSYVSHAALPAVPDDDDTGVPMRAMPKSAIRYTTTQGETVYQQGQRRLVVRPGRPPRRTHWAVPAGIAMLVMIAGGITWQGIASTWQAHSLDSQYGYPRTYQTDQVVGHHDSQAHPTHFIFLNLHGRIEIIEQPGGDITHARIYGGPTLVGEHADQVPVTGTFADVNQDGRLDLLVHVDTQTLVFVNDGQQFKPQQ